MVRAVIFDLDGLLVNTEVTWHKVFNSILAPYGYEMSIAEYVKNYSGKTIVENITNTIKHYQLPIDCETGIAQAILEEENYLKQGVDLKPGALELLQYLKKNQYKIVLGTSSKKERAVSILEFHDIKKYFDDIVCGYDVKRGKPYPDTFLVASERAQTPPEQCLVLEDSEAGIQAGFSAHIPVICIPDLKQPRQQYVDMTAAVLPSLLDVVEYLEKQE